MRPIFARWPGLRDRVPFEPLAALPSPVTEHDGVWLKRDDRIGGGKLRKLEFFPRGPVVAIGSEGSNWLGALARHRPGARIHGWPQAHNEDSRRNAAVLAGTRDRDLVLFGLRLLGELPRILGGSAAWAPIGGSDPVTTLGFVNAALELAGQVEAGDLPRPDAIFVPLGTAGTAAGLALGLALAGMGEVRLHAVRIVGGLMSTVGGVRRLLGPAAWLLDEAPRTCRVVVEEGFLGPGYAQPTPESRRAQAWAAPAVRLDASYAAKAAACLLARRSACRRPLLWVTSPPGDVPATQG